MEIYVVAISILVILALSDLIVGVSNDAVNFLNSSIGSRVAPRYIIMIIASLGIMAGVLFSSGMMEVARKGIFKPEHFIMPELMIIFLAVMLTDIILLDVYNTFGMPTSTTVSIVFELLGAAVAVSILKVLQKGDALSTIGNYINSGKALLIISGILLSVVIAFFAGAVVQFFTRLLFTFEYKKKIKRYGALWCGLALAAITYFILVKGAKGSSIIDKNTALWIKTHWIIITSGIFSLSFISFLLLQFFTKINIFKPVVLVGTFALAMAFAANDLVNFIGVPLAGISSYKVAMASGSHLTEPMTALAGKVKTDTFYLLIAGIIMVVTLWFSKKAKTVTKTEVNLGRQDEGIERFGSSPLSRSIVRMSSSIFSTVKVLFPDRIIKLIEKRMDTTQYVNEGDNAFDLVRASVNLMVASAVISFATSMKLPLSTTYVTFMVAMGTSLSDKAWGRESAAYRVTGVLTVIGGWFFTAFSAFIVAFIVAITIFYLKAYGVILVLILAALLIWKNRSIHKTREEKSEKLEVFNLKKITDADSSVKTTFVHTGLFTEKIAETLDHCFEQLFKENRNELKNLKNETKVIQSWGNIIIANIFKTLRLLQQQKNSKVKNYSRIINSIQEIAESHRDIVIRSYTHVDNSHKGLLDEQIIELKEVQELVHIMLHKVSSALQSDKNIDIAEMKRNLIKLEEISDSFNEKQIERIQSEESKTRLSILYYALINNSVKISKQTIELLETFKESYKGLV